MKVAIIADWLTSRGGAEEVIFDLVKIYPQAEIFTSVYNPKKFPELKKTTVHTSFLQKIPFFNKKHQLLISLMPLAFESFDLSKFNLVISSSAYCSKGVITKPSTLHVCYCHTPMRLTWDGSHQFIKEFPLPSLLKKLATNQIHKLRSWDYLASQRVDQFIANSNYISKRIQKYYKRNAIVIHPGTSINHQVPKPSPIPHKNFYLALGRLISYKRFDIIVKAFNQAQKNLVIIGKGNMLKKLKELNTNPNTHFLGFVDLKTKNQYLLQANALIFPQEEDFGITPIEAQSFGTPVIAYNKGGATETVTSKTGLFFQKQTPTDLNHAIQKFESQKFNPQDILKNAQQFDRLNFQSKIKQTIQTMYEQHQEKMG
jgi:glycosyltransferase involved in cell wall biosynthesis